MINWLKHNWSLAILIIIALIWAKNNLNNTSGLNGSPQYSALPISGGGNAESKMAVSNVMYRTPVAPSESTDRLVIQDTNLSLQVKDVPSVIKTIDTTAKGLGGFLVNSYLSKPDTAASGTISVRVPEARRSEALDEFKKLAVKVVSESVSGDDVTDSYVDLQSQLEILTNTKTKYEEILSRATKVEDLLNVQQQLTSLQQQIDNVKGQQKYYEQSAKLTKITIYLSTDELALPYSPTNEWRPAVVFKEAVRSLVATFRSLGNLIIWLVVFMPVIIPVLGIIWYYKKHHHQLQ